MNILLIGSNGYIGSELYKKLLENYNVTGIDINWYGTINDSIPMDYKNIDSSFLKQFDSIILLAGHSSVKMCDGPIQASYKNNVYNFLNLVKNCSKHQVIIYASSGSIYTHNDDNLFLPTNNYDLTKYILDLHSQQFMQERTIIGLRLGTVNGHSPNLRNELMINAMVRSAITQQKITINNVKVRRPILGINDLTKGINKILLKPVTGIYNLCSFNSTVEGIAQDISKKLNVPIQYEIDTSNPYDFYFDNINFEQTFDFKFRDSVATIVEDLLNNTPIITGDRNNFINY